MITLDLSRQPHRLPWTRARLEHERSIALRSVLEPASNSSYTSAVHSYLAFCVAHGFPIDPTPNTLSFFIVYMSSHIQPRSVESYLSGIVNQLESVFPDVRIARRHKLVANTLAGCKKLHSHPIRRKRALTRADISHVANHFSPSSDFDDHLFVCLTLTGFFGLLRVGELVWPDVVAHRDFRKLIARSSVTITPNAFSFTLPSHKADRFFEGNTVIIPSTSSDDDPLAPFLRYLKLRDKLFPFHSPLWLRSDGHPPTRSWFISRLRAFFPADIAGHSLRSGGATALAEVGTPLELIQAIGRWASEAFRIYIRSHHVVLAASVSCS